MDEPTIDLDEVRREIDAEVRARRAVGDYPPGFERDLDALFAQFAPAEASDDFDTALERAEEAVALEPVIPIASRNPGLLLMKKVVAKLIGWYHVWLVQQVTTLGATITHTLRLLGQRVDRIEQTTGNVERLRVAGATVAPVRDDDGWREVVMDVTRGLEGRVAVAECGNGVLVGSLMDGGLDAYGVEPRAQLADAAIGKGFEIRVDNARGHLDVVAAGALAGIVLRACTERLPTGELLELAAQSVPRSGPAAGSSSAASHRPRGATARPRWRPISRPVDHCGPQRGPPFSPSTSAIRSPSTSSRTAPHMSSSRLGRDRDPPVHPDARSPGRDRRALPGDPGDTAGRGISIRDLRAGSQGGAPQRARPFRSFRGARSGEETLLLYHASVGSPVGDWVAARPEPLLVDYHNITPMAYFAR